MDIPATKDGRVDWTQACRYHLGVDLVSHSDEAGESLLRMFWDHQDAVVLFVSTEHPNCGRQRGYEGFY
ncbi:unnamed protein product [Urochloa humidicola]